MKEEEERPLQGRIPPYSERRNRFWSSLCMRITFLLFGGVRVFSLDGLGEEDGDGDEIGEGDEWDMVTCWDSF